MTFGEMFAWTNRLNNILEVAGPLKNKRLQALLADLELAICIEHCDSARGLYLRVQEELTGYGGAI